MKIWNSITKQYVLWFIFPVKYQQNFKWKSISTKYQILHLFTIRLLFYSFSSTFSNWNLNLHWNGNNIFSNKKLLWKMNGICLPLNLFISSYSALLHPAFHYNSIQYISLNSTIIFHYFSFKIVLQIVEIFLPKTVFHRSIEHWRSRDVQECKKNCIITLGEGGTIHTRVVLCSTLHLYELNEHRTWVHRCVCFVG